ncbi:endo-1,4-beta-xylanase [Mangrovibacterium lignilyticum]|uniref:endo-1,4-beta-xylanase n=1 Tax=Mangrovibacterium lignilyticum TaxID=2668052 RepID=UPI0013D6066E|nr:endo-1,4-beta-xylanase [Mangrovibacterium lignilyticum]
MNYKNIIPFIALSSLLLTSCDDQIMDWYTDPSHGEITASELPLELAEKIERYEALNTYTDFTLGAGIGLDLYMNDETYRNITNANFDEVTVGYGMKHGPMVASDGSLKFDAVDAFIAKTKEAGLSTFGHTLLWHQNQNASYLNGLIAPTVIPAPAGSNSLDLSGLKDGSLSGWGAWNNGAGISVEDGSGLSSSSQAVKMIASSSSNAAYNLQLITPDITIVSGHTYEVSFYIKSDQAGKGRLSFDGLENNYPWKDWFNTGGSWTEAFETTSEWQQVKITISDFAASSFKIAFDLGYLPDVNYFIDVDNIMVIDLDAEPTIVNLITNGDFESGTLDGWGGWGNGSSRAVSATGEGYGDTGYAMVLTNPTAASNYQAQQVYTFAAALEQGVDYTCTFMVKADVAANLQVEIQSADYSANYYGGIAVGTSWMQVQKTITPTTADRIKFIFDFGETACTYHIDDIVFAKAEGGGSPSGPTIIEKTDEEKAQIIGDAMESWISGMVSHYKTDIHAWDVVNEPMRENGEVRDGDVTDLADDEFYWLKYLGKDYAVTAFNLARQNGNLDDKLFINDYNLESNLTKCDGLIAYVQYIEDMGATVDGIGTQMHISSSTDKDMIVQMFQRLAASGKLIKISELDVRLGTASPTAEQLTAQSDMYQYVIDQYREIIPIAQQYGITIWGISDNEQEHEYWLPDESPNLWDANYNRKHAYKGAADGLAGKDVSEDFSGELQY